MALTDRIRGLLQIEINQTRVASPCHVSWDSMKGDEQVRFCSQCQLNVYNLSGMTTELAARVLAQGGERQCVTFFRRADGTVLTRDCPEGAYESKRKRQAALKKTAVGGMVATVAAGALANPILAVRYAGERARPATPTSALRQAALIGDVAGAAAALRNGAKLDGDRPGTLTPLMLAVEAGNLPVARFLIAHGADVNQRDRTGRSVLDIAKESENAYVVETIRASGAKE